MIMWNIQKIKCINNFRFSGRIYLSSKVRQNCEFNYNFIFSNKYHSLRKVIEKPLKTKTYLLHLKLITKLSVDVHTFDINSRMAYFWRVIRYYALKPEVFFAATIVFAILFYLQVINFCGRSLLDKIQSTVGRTTAKVSKLQFFINGSLTHIPKLTWELKTKDVAAYAIQGHRSHMEDRFVINSDIDGTGVSIYAIFDGHGGEFAANYARDNLIPNLNKKISELKNMLAGKPSANPKGTDIPKETISKKEENGKSDVKEVNQKKTFRKSNSNATSDDLGKKTLGITDPELLKKLESLQRPITREVRPSREKALPKIELSSYVEGDKINYGKLLTDEILAVDRLLVEAAKKNMDVAGTTALIALLEGNKLTVANVGDSRGVMCDGKGNAIPLSFDHKPQQQRERTRIDKAGGFVIFNGVWRVAGVLATSRALGDYPLKDKKYVIADPDILTFELDDHNAQFLVLATDGLWDTFTNEDAVSFIKERLDEPHFGAKSIALQSYYRGSLDNITVLVINLRKSKKMN